MLRYLYLILVLSSILIVRMILFFTQPNVLKEGDLVKLETRLYSEPRLAFGNQRIEFLEKGITVFVNAPRLPEYHYGDYVTAEGKIKIKKIYSTTSKGVIEKEFYTLEDAKVKKVKGQKNALLSFIGGIREKTSTLFIGTLSPLFASLLMGITFGIKDGIPKEFMDSLKLTGLMHVIAASGMNVTMAAGAVSSFTAMFFKRQIALLISILVVFFYAFFAGLEPSIVRAAIMANLIFFAQIFGRQSLASFSLFLAAFLMLVFSPGLIIDLGFQLSFLATVGLIYFQPFVLRFMPKNIRKNWMVKEFTVVMAVQFATFPLLLNTFGTLSLISIPANLAILWVVPYLMTLGVLGSLSGLIFAPVGKIFLLMAIPLLAFFTGVVNFFSKTNLTLSTPELPWQIVVSYFCFMAALVKLRKGTE